jgi:hypothetical protein
MTLLVVLTVLTVARVARLITVDRISQRLRDRLAGITRDADGNPVGLPRRPLVAYLVTCPWCVSVYFAPFAAAATVWWPTNRAVWIVMLAGAASWVAGIAAGIEDALDRDCCLDRDEE